MTGIDRIQAFKSKLKTLPQAQKPNANHEDWRFTSPKFWEDICSLLDTCNETKPICKYINQLKELKEEQIHLIMDSVETVPWESPLPFLQTIDTHLCSALVVCVPANTEITSPIKVDLRDRIQGFLPVPLIILFEEGSRGRVILNATGVTPMIESVRVIGLKNSVGFLDIFEKTEGTWAIFEQIILLEQSQLTHNFLSLGHGIKRRDTTLNLIGKGAICHAYSAYLSHLKDYKELLIRQRHIGKNTISQVLEKGVALDSAYNILNGMIQIRSNSSNSEAYLTNNNLLLNSGARSHSIPRLEIEEKSVKCSHSSTASPLDPIQIFYMKSRGINENEARKILIESFLIEALEHADKNLVSELNHIFS